MKQLTEHGAAALAALLDAVFPPRCIGCARTGAHFCPTCVASIKPVSGPWCASCGRTLAAAISGLCAVCYLDPLPLVAVRCAGLLEGPLRVAIHRLKYRGRTAGARALAELLVTPARSSLAAVAVPSAVMVVPVPLHAMRQRDRGYNQAALLAEPLAAALGSAYDPGALRRMKATPSQIGSNLRQRRENVRGAFSALPAVRGRTVLLVDDVTTTGSTLGSAAAACLDAGAAEVHAVTLAREG
jgi:ComF family protein